ncbi:MAG TPA: DUF6687 family protein [Candidatus Thermoplasmatota archaeon]|nr:DUF6687 family protein [Candidatus Thermoplasmatota archaeon]
MVLPGGKENGRSLRYVPYEVLGTTPNVVVDGAAQEATVLTLSHWPGSGTHKALKADTSTEICFRYLSAPEIAPEAEEARAVSVNHEDVDGLLGMWALLNPGVAWDHLEDLVAAATADDFGRITSERGAWLALTFADLLREGYAAALPRVAHVLGNLELYEGTYRAAWRRIEADRDALKTGRATLEEHPDIDLAVFRSHAPLHEWAQNSATDRMRILEIVDGRIHGFRYRYETWVQFVSRPLPPRVDLTPFLQTLNAIEEHPDAVWEFDGIGDLVPRLQLLDARGDAVASRIEPDRFLADLGEYLRLTQHDPDRIWNPYDP